MSLFTALRCGLLNGVMGCGSLSNVAWRPSTDGGRRSFLFLVALILAGPGAASPAPAASASEYSAWHEFSGTWTAAGSRQNISLGGDRRASVADYSGSLMLYGSSRPALGFRAEAVVLNDSATGMIGRAVWTDETDNQVYSELRGETTPAGNRIIGTFVGGSGRYKGATGTYEFTWRFLL